MAYESSPQWQTGKLVALEGDSDAVATQLRLLPPSQKILILPSLVESLPQGPETHSFDPRAFVRGVQASFTERTEKARSFLQSSTNTQPRLVFMNGGSVSARTTCITRICENITDGDVREAEIIFNEIVKDGVAGLMRPEAVLKDEAETNKSAPADGEQLPEVVEMEEDPIVKAMKAADSLDRETAELQEESIEDSAVELSADTPSGTSGDETKAAQRDGLKVDPEAQQDISTASNGDDIIRTVVTVANKATPHAQAAVNTEDQASTTPTIATPTATTPHTAAPHQNEEDGIDYSDDDNDHDLATPEDGFFSVPPLPVVVYGEARVVDMGSATPRRSIRKVKSSDMFHPSHSSYPGWTSTPHHQIRHTRSAYHLGRPVSSGDRTQQDENTSASPILPRTTFMRASTTLIRKSSSLSRSRPSSVATTKVNVYVDRGTDAEDMVELVPVAKPQEVIPFQPVFELVEDFIIRFTHETPNDILQYVLSAYKNGSYPIFPPISESEPANQELHENVNGEVANKRPVSHLTAETDDDGFQRRHEFDPYADNNYPAGVNQWPSKDESSRTYEARRLQPPTPSMTPPPTAPGVPEKFCDFTPMNPNSVIGIQNSLRSLLNLHFPAGEDNYTQYCYPVPSEMDRLWKPVFRNDADSPIGNEGRTVDQIIALGCEEGVKKDFFTQISGQIEKLGMKRGGINKSSKIDLRYFIANAMQTHSNIPLTAQSTVNSFSDPEVLASYIVPQIESYLATNNSTRLLILHYQAQHLATIIALRKILGQDIFKIAGIMDSLSSDPPSSITKRTSISNPLSNEATLSLKRQSQTLPRDTSRRRSVASRSSSLASSSNDQLKKPDSAVSFSKANYLLPSSATGAEIATFLSGIWTSLMEKSIFYTPEPEPEPKTIIVEKVVEKIVEKIVEKPALPSSLSVRDANHPAMSFRGQGRDSKLGRLAGEKTPPRTPTNAKGHKYAASIASTARTTASERYRREEARIERDWENFYIGEEDSEDDDYDRMILGREMAKIVPEVRMVYAEGKAPKRSTKKALKWLGLA